MSLIILCVGLIIVVYVLSQFIFNRHWVNIRTCFGYEDYFKVVAKLKGEGIKYKTRTPLNRGERSTFKDSTQYDVWVKKEDEDIALKALNRK